MLAFIVRRLLWTVPVVLLVILFTFLLVRQIAIGPFATENLPSAVQERFNLDTPWYTQYGLYVKNLLSLDLGPSRIYPDRTVTDIISEQFPNSALLGALAFGWALAVGIPAGILAALRVNSRIDYAVMVLATSGLRSRTSSSLRSSSTSLPASWHGYRRTAGLTSIGSSTGVSFFRR